MTTFTRRRLGLGFVFLSLLAGIVLYLFGVPLITYESHAMPVGARDGVSTMHIATHWPLVVLCATAMIGAVLAAVSRDGKTNG
jgi:hypothetical protein